MNSIILIFFALPSISLSTTADAFIPEVEPAEEPVLPFMPWTSNLHNPFVGGVCLSEHNAARSAHGKAPLTTDPLLEAAARNHNQQMTSQDTFSHQCPSELTLGPRVTHTGYEWWKLGENIAVDYPNCSVAMGGWMNSEGHRKNVLGDYIHVGCAMATCNGCSYPNYWTCVFGQPQD